MSDYTPTTDEVMRGFRIGPVVDPRIGEYVLHVLTRREKERWLEAHDREVAAKAWDEGFTRGFYSGQAMRSDADASESPVENPYDADRIEQGGDEE